MGKMLILGKFCALDSVSLFRVGIVKTMVALINDNLLFGSHISFFFLNFMSLNICQVGDLFN
jgi:hypothetical protein